MLNFIATGGWHYRSHVGFQAVERTWYNWSIPFNIQVCWSN